MEKLKFLSHTLYLSVFGFPNRGSTCVRRCMVKEKKNNTNSRMCCKKQTTSREEKCSVSSQENNVTQHWNSFVSRWISLFELTLRLHTTHPNACKNVEMVGFFALVAPTAQSFDTKECFGFKYVRCGFRSLYLLFFLSLPHTPSGNNEAETPEAA